MADGRSCYRIAWGFRAASGVHAMRASTMSKLVKTLDSKTQSPWVEAEAGGSTLPALAKPATTAITNAIGLTPEEILLVVASETTSDLGLDALLDRASQSHRYTDLLERYDAVFYWRLGRDLTAAKVLCPHGDWSRRLKARRISPWQWHQAKHIFLSYGDPSGLEGKTLTAVLKEVGIYQEDKGKRETVELVPPVSGEGTPIAGKQREPNIASTGDHPRTADTGRIKAGPTPSPNPQPEAQAQPFEGTPPEEAMPLAVDFRPPPSEIEMPSDLAEAVEWLRRAAIWLAWLFADFVPPPKYHETHQRFLRVVDGWRPCRPKPASRATTATAKALVEAPGARRPASRPLTNIGKCLDVDHDDDVPPEDYQVFVGTVTGDYSTLHALRAGTKETYCGLAVREDPRHRPVSEVSCPECLRAEPEPAADFVHATVKGRPFCGWYSYDGVRMAARKHPVSIQRVTCPTCIRRAKLLVGSGGYTEADA